MSGLSLPRKAEPDLHSAGDGGEGGVTMADPPSVSTVPLTSPAGSQSSGTQDPVHPAALSWGRKEAVALAHTHSGNPHPRALITVSRTSSTAATLGLARAAHGQDLAGPRRVPPTRLDPAPGQKPRSSCALARPSHCLDEAHPLDQW